MIYFAYKAINAYLKIRFLAKAEDEVNSLKAAIQNNLNRDVEEHMAKFDSYHDPKNHVTRMFVTEEELVDRIKRLQAELEHENAVYFKFVRARERFKLDKKNSNMALLHYHYYLRTKNQFLRNADSTGAYLEHGIKSIEQLHTESVEFKIMLEEAEAKLDLLLGGHPS